MSTVYITPNHDTSMVNNPTELVDNTYNGWANYETWNVALWIGNDEGLYSMAREYRNHPEPYISLIGALYDCGSTETPDGVKWASPMLDTDELNEMMDEL